MNKRDIYKKCMIDVNFKRTYFIFLFIFSNMKVKCDQSENETKAWGQKK